MREVPFKFIPITELKNHIDLEKPVMADTETIGLYGKIRIIQFFQEGWEEVLIVENPDPFQLVAAISKAHLVFHNAHYDISTIQANLGGITWLPEKYDCTFLLSRLHFFKKEKFSLDEVVKYVLDVDIYGDDKKEMHKADWSVPVLSTKQIAYAASDVLYLYDVYNVVNTQEENINYRLDILSTNYALDFQNNGFPFDETKLNAQYAHNLARIEAIALPINCNSYQQVREYIGSNMSDDLGLSTLIAQGNTRAKDVKETRKLTKENSFLKKFLDTADDGCIFGKFKFSPRSGRSASDSQNLQQLPRSTKGIFGVSTEDDIVIIYSDFSQMQLRGVCAVTGDKTMEELFRKDEDIHSYVAKIIFGENYTKQDRQICKTANFGLLFGAGVATFQNILLKQAGLNLPEDEAAAIKKKWLQLWKEVAAWQTEGIRAWKRKEAWETPLGRRYTARMMTDQLAMQIQGFEAEVAKLSMHYMMPKLKELDPGIKLRNFVHDSYIYTCPKDEQLYKAASLIIAESMQEGWQEMSQSVKIKDLPMPVNVRAGYNWGDIEDGEYIYELNKD